MKNIVKILLSAVCIFVMLCGCGSTAAKGIEVDYGNADAFEAALNNGEDLAGKTVQFTAGEFHPDSKL